MAFEYHGPEAEHPFGIRVQVYSVFVHHYVLDHVSLILIEFDFSGEEKVVAVVIWV